MLIISMPHKNIERGVNTVKYGYMEFLFYSKPYYLLRVITYFDYT